MMFTLRSELRTLCGLIQTDREVATSEGIIDYNFFHI